MDSHKKIFISYAWGDAEYQKWIVNLGTRLMSDSVDVVLDRWSLKDGHDIHSFMEEMVKSEDIFRVLILCDKKYSEKADERMGGVGTETQIITPNIYSIQKQEKFLPIVVERDESGKPYLPVYLASRKYIDFSNEENFEDSYEELLRNILEAPSIPKPKLGVAPPKYITDNKINLSETNSKIRTIENQLKKNNSLHQKYIKDFLDCVTNNLWDFQLNTTTRSIEEYGDILIEQLKSYKPLREDYLKFIDLISEIEIEGDFLIEFFENQPLFERPKDENINQWIDSNFAIFKIIFHELFLYTIAILLKNKNYKLIEELLHSKYFVKDRYNQVQETYQFTFLDKYHQLLEDYMSIKYNKITGFGDYVINNLSDQVSKDDFIVSDMLCYVVSSLGESGIYDSWFPYTYLYGKRRKFPFFEKISSSKHFEKIKGILGVNDKDNLIQKLTKLKDDTTNRRAYRNGFDRIPLVTEIINLDSIAIYR